jgi:hypothetical protein
MKLSTPLPRAVARVVAQPLRRRIQALWWLKWLAFPVAPLLVAVVFKASLWTLLFALVCLLLHGAVNAWEVSQRRQFIREARFPAYLGAKLMAQYPQLRATDTELVLHGLRQFFMGHLRSRRQFVAMPSKVVDAAWHEFILHTRAYEAWCNAAFGKLLHHTPAEVLGRDPKRNDGLRRAWYWACKEESINPRQPARLPLLFALDKKFAITGGFSYLPDCSDINRQAGSDAYCGTSFGEGGGGGGASGDADGFGGSESSSSDAGGDGGSDSSGCGGGCGGD